MIYLLFLPFLGLLLTLLISFWTFDQLVKLEYQEHHDVWMRDGKPSGFLWRPQESKGFKSSLARSKLSSCWPLMTPDWTKQSTEGKKLIKRLRVCVAIWNLGFIAWLAILYVITTR
jgi:hypothetical protein